MRTILMLPILLAVSSITAAEEKWDVEVLLSKATPVIRAVLKEEAHVVQDANMQISNINECLSVKFDELFLRQPKNPYLKEIRSKIGSRPYWRIAVGVRTQTPEPGGGFVFYFSRDGEYIGVYKYL